MKKKNNKKYREDRIYISKKINMQHHYNIGNHVNIIDRNHGKDPANNLYDPIE